METHVTVQIHALKPSWINYEKNRYRLYLDNNLFTERDWIWDLNICIDENIWIDSESGTTHSLRIEPILQQNSVAQFGFRTLKINNNLVSELTDDLLELSFTI